MKQNSTQEQAKQKIASYAVNLDQGKTSDSEFTIETATAFLQEVKNKVTRRFTFDDNGGGYEGL
jgi:hypothetical protein